MHTPQTAARVPKCGFLAIWATVDRPVPCEYNADPSLRLQAIEFLCEEIGSSGWIRTHVRQGSGGQASNPPVNSRGGRSCGAVVLSHLTQ